MVYDLGNQLIFVPGPFRERNGLDNDTLSEFVTWLLGVPPSAVEIP